jgi:NAD(P)H-hydrate epimerase
MKTITSHRARLIDRRATEELGISALVMMENAGIRVADFILQILKKKRNLKVAIFCGKGNNAGDGLVVSRQLLSKGIRVDTFLLASGEDLPVQARANLNILSRMSKNIFRIKNDKDLGRIKFSDYALLVDAIFGIGLKGKVRGIFSKAVQKINSARRPTVSIDIPSGLGADSGYPHGVAIKAHYTITFIAPKRGLCIHQGPRFSGRVITEQIGFLNKK